MRSIALFLLCMISVGSWASFATKREIGSTSAIAPVELRTEYAVDPPALETQHPRFSWRLQPHNRAGRALRQTAFEILVSASKEKLQTGSAEMWNSGRVPSDATSQVEYSGRPLLAGARYWWKVRVWDGAGQPSPWSAPALWSMGLLNRRDWKARWIEQPDAVVTAHNGYRSEFANSAASLKWVAIDLLLDKVVDVVKLYPTKPIDIADAKPGYLFPVRFRIDIASTADFATFRTLVDQTAEDFANPGAEAAEFRFAPVRGRYVRLLVAKLAEAGGGQYGFALAEMEVLQSDTRPSHPLLPVSRAGAVCSASDSYENGVWSLQNLNDTLTAAQKAKAGPPAPATMLRSTFSLKAPVARARIYASALGIYELHLNGKRVGDHVLAPEWTDYHIRVQYQTYDVTKLLRTGRNAIGALVGAGWYAGRVPFAPGRRFYGDKPKFIVQLDIEFADGTRQSIVTDESWRATTGGPIREDDIYDGEVYDSRKEMPSWDTPEFNDSGWKAASAAGGVTETPMLVSQYDEPIQVITDVRPVAIREPVPGVYVVDMGQNMVGWVRARLHGPADTKITLRHAEVLQDDGNIYTDNLRENLQGARQTDIYYLSGSADQIFEPHFTYHGFRYVEVTGLSYRPTLEMFIGRVIHTSAAAVGSLETSSNLVNKILRNIWWTQIGNLMGIPTDCPQRGERAGWMGDAQVFSQAAMFNMDLSRFYTKWFQDIRDAQGVDGAFSAFAPSPFGPAPAASAPPGWSDAGVLVPWQMYVNYGDKRILSEHFDAAKRYVDGIIKANPDLVWRQARGAQFLDWLNADTIDLADWPHAGAATPGDLFATAFLARSTQLVADIAQVLGRLEDARDYTELAARVRSAFQKQFVRPDGSIHAESASDPKLATGAGTSTDGNNQTSYALALNFGLFPQELQVAAAKRMADNVRAFRGGYLSTGLHGTNRLMLELTDHGYNDLAYKLLNNREVPSWGYMVDHGATTVWERWDGYVEGRGYQSPYMNSFNHYGLGAVAEWMYRTIGGINPDPAQPGYRHSVIRPQPGQGVTWARATYEALPGSIKSAWRQDAGQFTLNVTVPVNTTATVYVPAAEGSAVLESGKPAGGAPGVKSAVRAGAAVVLELGSGEYEFTVRERTTRAGDEPKDQAVAARN